QPKPENHTLATFVARDGRGLAVRRHDWVPSDAGHPTVCHWAEDTPAPAGPKLADFLDTADRACRRLGLVREDQSVYWCGRARPGHGCVCPILRPEGVEPPPGWDEARALYQAADVLSFVRERERPGHTLTAAEQAELEALATRGGLRKALGPPPPVP